MVALKYWSLTQYNECSIVLTGLLINDRKYSTDTSTSSGKTFLFLQVELWQQVVWLQCSETSITRFHAEITIISSTYEN